MTDPTSDLQLSDEVAGALDRGAPVVALESTIISHGLPRPRNLAVARRVEDVVRAAGATPATIAVLDGLLHVGLDGSGLERVATEDAMVKASVRDLPVVVARRASAATTVAATAALAHRAGIGVFATGGLGGVHREASGSFDESADLTTLARTPLAVVCAGVKSILDVGATLERLETLGVTVLGYRTDRFPGFYLTDGGHPLDWRAETPDEVAAVLAARASTGVSDAALVVANPLPVDEQVDPALHDEVLREALSAATGEGVRGKAVTPFLLERFHARTGGESLRANEAIILRNAQLAAQIAVAHSG